MRCAEASRDALEDPEAFMWADIELHAQIARAASQRRARAAAGVDRGHGHRQPPPHRPAGAVREQSAHDHREIAAAIAAHDAEAAYAAMLRHLENVERAVTG